MKKTILILCAIVATCSPLLLKAKDLPRKEAHFDAADPQKKEINSLLFRLNQINELDKSDLSRSEKIQLRGEVKQIEEKLATHSNGIYLSAGAIIIIVILLIILL